MMKKRGLALFLTLALACAGSVFSVSAETTAETPAATETKTDTTKHAEITVIQK